MAIKKVKPTSPGRRFTTFADFAAPDAWPGLVRGFHIPARRACTLPVAAICLVVATI